MSDKIPYKSEVLQIHLQDFARTVWPKKIPHMCPE